MFFPKNTLAAPLHRAMRHLAHLQVHGFAAGPRPHPHAPPGQHHGHLGHLAHLHGHGPGLAHPVWQPPPVNPMAPLGTVPFANHLLIPRSQQTRHGGELQVLRFRGRSLGVMTRYPADDRDVAQLLRSALSCHPPRITNLMDRGDMGIQHSYVDRMPEGRSCRIHDLEVCKVSVGIRTIGPNTQGEPMTHERCHLYVRDPKRPDKGWQFIEYNAFPHWLDTTAPPEATFERLWRAHYVRGQLDQGLVHCAGGVGRTPTFMFRLIVQAFIDEANARGRIVGHQEVMNFLADLINVARELRGHQVLPDRKQIELLYRSCAHGVEQQLVGGAAATGLAF